VAKTQTSRHLAEFWMIEPEIALADLADNAALAEALLKHTFAALLKERGEDLAFFDQRIERGWLPSSEGLSDRNSSIWITARRSQYLSAPMRNLNSRASGASIYSSSTSAT
jgi:aspartyl/asparaginyl-tRNA synthetase